MGDACEFLRQQCLRATPAPTSLPTGAVTGTETGTATARTPALPVDAEMVQNGLSAYMDTMCKYALEGDMCRAPAITAPTSTVATSDSSWIVIVVIAIALLAFMKMRARGE